MENVKALQPNYLDCMPTICKLVILNNNWFLGCEQKENGFIHSKDYFISILYTLISAQGTNTDKTYSSDSSPTMSASSKNMSLSALTA